LGRAQHGELFIELYDNTPVVYRPYCLSLAETEFVKKAMENMKKYSVIQDSKSLYPSPIPLIKEKTGETRMCIDFCRLNLKAVKDK